MDLQKIVTGHVKSVHCIAHNFYGNRLASASADHTIEIFECKTSEKGEETWEYSASINVHNSAVLRVCWANPQFGQIIASCSSDLAVCVSAEGENRKWINKDSLQANSIINDVAFAPAQLGLVLGYVSSDNFLHIYVCESENAKFKCYGTYPLNGLPTRLSWCSYSRNSSCFVAIAEDKSLRIIDVSFVRNSHTATFQDVCTFTQHNKTIQALAWAPNPTRRNHLIATGGEDCRGIIWDLSIGDDGEAQNSQKSEAPKEYKVEEKFSEIAFKSEIWGIGWNVLGTVLVISTDDGIAHIFKPVFASTTQPSSLISEIKQKDWEEIFQYNVNTDPDGVRLK